MNFNEKEICILKSIKLITPSNQSPTVFDNDVVSKLRFNKILIFFIDNTVEISYIKSD